MPLIDSAARPRSLTLVALVACLLASLPPARLSAQPTETPRPIPADPDVLAAERLFSAWIEGQIAYAVGGVVGEVVRFVEENGRVVRMYTLDSYADRAADIR